MSWFLFAIVAIAIGGSAIGYAQERRRVARAMEVRHPSEMYAPRYELPPVEPDDWSWPGWPVKPSGKSEPVVPLAREWDDD